MCRMWDFLVIEYISSDLVKAERYGSGRRAYLILSTLRDHDFSLPDPGISKKITGVLSADMAAKIKRGLGRCRTPYIPLRAVEFTSFSE